MYVLSETIEIVKIFPMKFSILHLKYIVNLCILHGQVFVMIIHCTSSSGTDPGFLERGFKSI